MLTTSYILLCISIKLSASFNILARPDAEKIVRPYSVQDNSQEIPNPIYFGFNINIRNQPGSSNKYVSN